MNRVGKTKKENQIIVVLVADSCLHGDGWFTSVSFERTYTELSLTFQGISFLQKKKNTVPVSCSLSVEHYCHSRTRKSSSHLEAPTNFEQREKRKIVKKMNEKFTNWIHFLYVRRRKSILGSFFKKKMTKEGTLNSYFHCQWVQCLKLKLIFITAETRTAKELENMHILIYLRLWSWSYMKFGS